MPLAPGGARTRPCTQVPCQRPTVVVVLLGWLGLPDAAPLKDLSAWRCRSGNQWHPRVESSHLTLLRREGSTSLSVGMEPSERVELSSQRSKRRGQVRWRRLEWTCGDSNPGLAKHTSSCYSHPQLQAGSCTTVPSLRLSQALPRLHSVSPESPSPLLLPGCGDLALLSCDGKPAGSGLLSSSVFSDGC